MKRVVSLRYLGEKRLSLRFEHRLWFWCGFISVLVLFYLPFSEAILTIHTAEAQVPRRRIQKRVVTRNLSSSERAASSFSFSSQITEILNASAEIDDFDTLTINQLRLLKDDAQPWWDPEDQDIQDTKNVVQKALVIRSAQSIIPLIKRSELRGSYRSAQRTFRSFSDFFRYSVQDDGQAYVVSTRPKGDTLMELNLDLDFKHGLDPQLKVGDFFRFRYDWAEARTLFEYGFDF